MLLRFFLGAESSIIGNSVHSDYSTTFWSTFSSTTLSGAGDQCLAEETVIFNPRTGLVTRTGFLAWVRATSASSFHNGDAILLRIVVSVYY